MKTTRVSPFVLTRVSMVFAFYLILVNVIKDLEEKTVLNVRFILVFLYYFAFDYVTVVFC